MINAKITWAGSYIPILSSASHVQISKLNVHKNVNIFLSISLNICLDTQNNCLIETVLLSTHNIHFVWKITKWIFSHALLSGGLTRYILLWTTWQKYLDPALPNNPSNWVPLSSTWPSITNCSLFSCRGSSKAWNNTNTVYTLKVPHVKSAL